MTEAKHALLQRCLKKAAPFSQSVSHLMTLLNKNPVDLPAACKLIETDPVLTLAILRLANSAFYGFPRKIDKVSDAAVLIGIHSLQQMVISFSLIKSFPAKAQQVIDTQALWEHSISVAVIARILAKQLHEDEDLAFTAGVLHNIGLFVLAQGLGEQYQPVLDYRQQHACLLREAEQQLLATDHCEIGAAAISQWHLPRIFSDVASQPGAGPDIVSEHWLIDVVQLAVVLAKGLWITENIDPQAGKISFHTLERLALEMDQIESMLPTMAHQSQETIECLLGS